MTREPTMLTWKRLLAGVVLLLGAGGAAGAMRQDDLDPVDVAMV